MFPSANFFIERNDLNKKDVSTNYKREIDLIIINCSKYFCSKLPDELRKIENHMNNSVKQFPFGSAFYFNFDYSLPMTHFFIRLAECLIALSIILVLISIKQRKL